MAAERDSELIENVWKLAESVRVAMLTLHDGESLSARPMYSLIPEGEEVVWFITDRHSPKIAEAAEDVDALLTFSNGLKGENLVMTGTIRIVDDRAKLKALWSTGADLYFPKGPDDPSAILLRFEPERGEYWKGGTGAIGFALQYAKAKLTGRPAKLGDHGQVGL
jgi:general stress protein 26